jgi:hypothetical protein
MSKARENAVDDPEAFNHCFADVNGIRMHYVEEGQGPLVILLHGYRSCVTVPDTLPPFLSQQALDYYVAEFTRTGIQSANNSWAAIDKGWENTSFLDGAVVQQPALFLTVSTTPRSGHCWGSTGKGRYSDR